MDRIQPSSIARPLAPPARSAVAVAAAEPSAALATVAFATAALRIRPRPRSRPMSRPMSGLRRFVASMVRRRLLVRLILVGLPLILAACTNGGSGGYGY